jgi:Fis family transcriptional regulator, factor for inversion stimulation protein
MTTHALSLPHPSEIPQASVSETKLIGEAPPESGPAAPLGAPTPLGAAALEDDWPTLSTLSRRYIGRALERTHGNKTRAADLLAIDRRTLNRILARERARKGTAVKKAPTVNDAG